MDFTGCSQLVIIPWDTRDAVGYQLRKSMGYMGCFGSENRWDTWDALGPKIDGILGYMGCFEVLGANIDGILGCME